MRRRGPRYRVTRAEARAAVARHHGNVAAAARELGVAWLTLRQAYDRLAHLEAL